MSNACAWEKRWRLRKQRSVDASRSGAKKDRVVGNFVIHGQLLTRLAPASLPIRPHWLLRSRAGLALVAHSPQPAAFPQHQPGSATRSASHCPWPFTSPGGMRPPSPSKAGQCFSSEASPWCSPPFVATLDARCWPSPTDSCAATTRSPALSSRLLITIPLLSEARRFHPILCAQFLHGYGKMIADGSL